MDIRIDLNEANILQKVTNDRFGLLVSAEWKRLIDPYTPKDTGIMQDTAKVQPWQIHYVQPYSRYVYYGKGFQFKKKNPYSTDEWDVAAAEAGQLQNLTRTLNNALQSGQF